MWWVVGILAALELLCGSAFIYWVLNCIDERDIEGSKGH